MVCRCTFGPLIIKSKTKQSDNSNFLCIVMSAHYAKYNIRQNKSIQNCTKKPLGFASRTWHLSYIAGLSTQRARRDLMDFMCTGPNWNIVHCWAMTVTICRKSIIISYIYMTYNFSNVAKTTFTESPKIWKVSTPVVCGESVS